MLFRSGVPPQIAVTPGMPVRQGIARRQARVRSILHTLPPAAQAAILEDLNANAAPGDEVTASLSRRSADIERLVAPETL